MNTMKKTIYLDIETNTAHNIIWCCGVQDGDGTAMMFTDSIGLQELIDSADEVVGHNIIGFDAPVLKRVWNIEIPAEKQTDTLVLSRLAHADERKHSLEVWGERLKFPKIDFHDYDGGLTEEMKGYCVQDVALTARVHEVLLADLQGFSERSIKLEHEVAFILKQQEVNGFKLDIEKCNDLFLTVEKEMEEITEKLQIVFPPECTPNLSEKQTQQFMGNTIPKFNKAKLQPFNVGSRQQIAERLMLHGIKLTEKTEKGQWIINEKVLDKLDTAETRLINRYLMLQKRAAQTESWLKAVSRDGRVHGRVITNGAITGRMTHCVPMTTKALTRDGWKTYAELKVGEEILAFNMQTQMQEWTRLQGKQKFKNAEVGSVGTDTRRIRCTADHKLVEVISPGKPYQKLELRSAKNIRKHSAILINAPYDNANKPAYEELPESKYDTNQLSRVTRMSRQELAGFLTGFCLADGWFRNGSWSFTQAEGHLLDTAQTALYLHSNTRVSRACKTTLKGENQRYGYNVTNTQCSWLRASKRMEWEAETVEDVWCPTTNLDTWVMMQEDGLITISGNSNPNMAQVPAVSVPFGRECRECWTVDEGNVLVGADASGLELRMLAHYMDDEEYTHEVLSGDIHTANQKAAGLPTRDNAKTFIYAFLYGAGAGKIGEIVGGSYKKGTELIEAFLENTPALSELRSKTMLSASTKDKHGKATLKGLDGRKLIVRSEHSSLNTLLQGAGAIVMKEALVLLDKALKELKLPHKFVANVHDEWQIEVPEWAGHAVGMQAVYAIREAGKTLGLNCPLDGEYKIGKTWADTH